MGMGEEGGHGEWYVEGEGGVRSSAHPSHDATRRGFEQQRPDPWAAVITRTQCILRLLEALVSEVFKLFERSSAARYSPHQPMDCVPSLPRDLQSIFAHDSISSSSRGTVVNLTLGMQFPPSRIGRTMTFPRCVYPL